MSATAAFGVGGAKDQWAMGGLAREARWNFASRVRVPVKMPYHRRMTYSANFRCFAGCSGVYPLEAVMYRCPQCQGLLTVAHDMQALRASSGHQWQALFDARWRDPRAVAASGIWGKREWVAPQIRAENIVSFAEGYSPQLAVPRYATALGVGSVAIKQCGLSHTGSFKDLGMTVLVSAVKQMIVDGAPLRAIACASTGDTSAALAAYAAQAGIPAFVIVPHGKISPAQLVQPLVNGAHVLQLETDFDGCMRIVQQLALDSGIYLANSMNSLRVEGQKTVAFEIAQQRGWQVPDWVVVPGGNLGNVSALYAGFKMMHDLGVTARVPRILVGQTQAAAPLFASYQQGWAPLAAVAAQPTVASAIQIGNPVSFGKAVAALTACDGAVAAASEADIVNAAARVDRYGIAACPHTGVALAALEQAVARGVIARTDEVVVVSTANALKFAEVQTQYHTAQLPTVAPHTELPWRNQPQVLPNTYDAVRATVERLCHR